MNEDSPRTKPFAENPGVYKLLARTNSEHLDPDEDLKIVIFITGYGDIQAAKIVAYPSIESIDNSKSKILCVLRQGYYSHAIEGKLDLGGATIYLSCEGSDTRFADVKNKDSNLQILTETLISAPDDTSHAPVTLDLKLKKEIRSGQHKLSFVLTYYNGEAWCNSETIVQFTIRNLYQRNEMLIWGLGFGLTIAGFLVSCVALYFSWSSYLLELKS